ncbi:MAG: alpha/beta hydrolase [Desulfobacteraceae bacterium]
MEKAAYDFLQTFDGLRIRWAYWRTGHMQRNGTVVLLGGRAEFIEKYEETVHDLGVRGFDVYAMDWRGQGLSERMLDDADKGFVETYEHYVRDLKDFLETIVLDRCPRPLILMAHSMGACIVLHFLERHRDIVDKGVLMSPMVDVRTNPMPYALAKWCSRQFVRLGRGDAAIPSLQRNDSYGRPFRSNWLTSDPARFRRVQAVLKKNPRLGVRLVTFSWLSATFAALDQLRRPDFCTSIQTPLLLVAAGNDRVVSNDAIRQLAGRLAHSRSMTIDGARHEILQERDGMRSRFWQAFDGFVGR